MHLKVLVTAGDGIGPEVTNEAVAVLKEVAELGGHTLALDYKRIGGVAIVQDGTPLPAETLEAALASDAVLLGAVGGNEFNSLPPDKRPEAGLLQIRSALGGFANLRPAFAFKELAVNSPLRPEIVEGADILFVRELLGGLYFVARVARIAFQLASQRRKKLTSVDKANVLEVSQLWRATVNEVASEFPGVTVEHQYVDAMAMHLMNQPRNYDVVLTENLFGDILSDESAVITGSLGMLPSATIGGKVNLYEPVHGSAPDIAGKGLANPLGAILTGALILRHSAKLEAEATAIEASVRKVLEQGFRTPDLARSNAQGFTVLSTKEMGSKVRETANQLLASSSQPLATRT
jgi:3-isopropylmalate dehydrogenase